MYYVFIFKKYLYIYFRIFFILFLIFSENFNIFAREKTLTFRSSQRSLITDSASGGCLTLKSTAPGLAMPALFHAICSNELPSNLKIEKLQIIENL